MRRSGVRGLILSSNSVVTEEGMELLRLMQPISLVLSGVQLPVSKLRIADIAPLARYIGLGAKCDFDLAGATHLRGISINRLAGNVDALEEVAGDLLDIDIDGRTDIWKMLVATDRPKLKAGRFSRVADAAGVSRLPGLHGLMLVDCRGVVSCDFVRDCGRLEDLVLDGCRVVSVAELSGCTSLKRVFLENCGPLDSVMPLQSLGNLAQVVIGGSTDVLDGKVGWLSSCGLTSCRVKRRLHYDIKKSIGFWGDVSPLMQYKLW